MGRNPIKPSPDEIRQMIADGEQTLHDERNLRMLERLGFDPDTVCKWNPDTKTWDKLSRNLDELE